VPPVSGNQLVTSASPHTVVAVRIQRFGGSVGGGERARGMPPPKMTITSGWLSGPGAAPGPKAQDFQDKSTDDLLDVACRAAADVTAIN
jgi:hypothetical protein